MSRRKRDMSAWDKDSLASGRGSLCRRILLLEKGLPSHVEIEKDDVY